MIVTFILELRDGRIIIPKHYYEKYLDIGWFFSGLVNFPYNTDNKGDDELLKDVNQRLKIQKEIILNISKSFEESIFNAEKSLEK